MNEITQTNFSLAVTIPNIDCEHCVLRMRYLSNNPTENDRGMIFYQCADVQVNKAANDPSLVTAPKDMAVAASNDDSITHDCCAASSFSMSAYETASWRNPTHKQYHFDTANKLFRVDTISGTGMKI